MYAEADKQNYKEAIVRTMAFFDIFDFPPTEFEIFTHLDKKIDFLFLQDELSSLLREGTIREKRGYFYFPLRGKIIDTRLRRYNYTLRKIKRAKNVSRIFRMFPWIRMIAVANLIGPGNLKNSGDIDFFIICKKGRIWLSRFATVLVIKFLGLRPRISNTRDKICLSFFITETNADLTKYMLKEGEDLYLLYWFTGLFPIYDAGEVYSSFFNTNLWIKQTKPNFYKSKTNKRWRLKNVYSDFYYELMDLFFGGLETEAKKLQKKILPWEIKNAMNKNGGVVIGDEVLKMHVNDRRHEFQEKFKYRLKQFLNQEKYEKNKTI